MTAIGRTNLSAIHTFVVIHRLIRSITVIIRPMIIIMHPARCTLPIRIIITALPTCSSSHHYPIWIPTLLRRLTRRLTMHTDCRTNPTITILKQCRRGVPHTPCRPRGWHSRRNRRITIVATNRTNSHGGYNAHLYGRGVGQLHHYQQQQQQELHRRSINITKVKACPDNGRRITAVGASLAAVEGAVGFSDGLSGEGMVIDGQWWHGRVIRRCRHGENSQKWPRGVSARLLQLGGQGDFD